MKIIFNSDIAQKAILTGLVELGFLPAGLALKGKVKLYRTAKNDLGIIVELPKQKLKKI